MIGLEAGGTNPITMFLSKLGFSLLWGVMAYALIVDWSGSISLGGRIHWRRMPSDNRFAFGSLYILFFVPFLLGIYLLIAVCSYGSLAPLAASVAVRRQRLGAITASLVLLGTLLMHTTGNAAPATPSTPVAHQTQRTSMQTTSNATTLVHTYPHTNPSSHPHSLSNAIPNTTTSTSSHGRQRQSLEL